MDIATELENRDYGSRSPQHSLPYTPAWDGLRGIAVALVFVAHLVHFKGGTFGVDIFFVLSGYLITDVIYRSKDDAEFFGIFYFRRFVRLFPALALLCVVAICANEAIGFSENIYKDALSSILYTQSWTSTLKDGFSLYLGHTWSLSVEEQFYILWPPILFLLTRRNDAKVALLAALLLLLCGILWHLHLSHSNIRMHRIYFAPDMRFDEILIGAIGPISLRIPEIKRLADRFIRYVSVIPALAIAWILSVSNWSFYSSLAISVLSLILIMRLAAANNFAEAKLMRFPPLVGLGKISYGFYLWHAPILLLLQLHFQLSSAYVFIVGLAATLVLSISSYIVVELPAQRLRSTLPRHTQFRLGIVALSTSILSIAGGLIYFQWKDIQTHIFS